MCEILWCNLVCAVGQCFDSLSSNNTAGSPAQQTSCSRWTASPTDLLFQVNGQAVSKVCVWCLLPPPPLPWPLLGVSDCCWWYDDVFVVWWHDTPSGLDMHSRYWVSDASDLQQNGQICFQMTKALADSSLLLPPPLAPRRAATVTPQQRHLCVNCHRTRQGWWWWLPCWFCSYTCKLLNAYFC